MVKIRMKRLCLSILLIFSMLAAGCNGETVSTSASTPAKDMNAQRWIEDIDYLYTKLPKAHKNIYHSITKEKFEKEITDLKSDVPKLKDYEIKCRLAQIVASIGDAHTSMNIFNESNVYPVELNWFDKELRIVSTDDDHKGILGKKLVSINKVPVDEIIKKADLLISHENDQWLKVMDVQYIVMPDVLKLLGITSEDKIQFSVQDDNNNISTIDLEPENFASKNVVRVMDEMPVKPLWLQYNTNILSQRLYWYKYVPEDKILYFQYNQCIDKSVAKRYGIKDYDEFPDFKQFSEGLLKEVDNDNIDKFIVDLRFNSGGDSALMSTLVSKLAKVDKLKGKVYVMIGKKTFSSGIMAAVDLMKDTKAVSFGEPSGGNVNGYGEVKNLVLPNSKLVIGYSTKYFKLSDKFNKNFIPDVTVEQTFNHYKNGIDEVYEAVKHYN